ncbi:MAG TPA: GIY-YIG nuclease family protein [Halothiobacillaceae bacterium]|nr:GIY-YIG nuclease family protein [Halothiobacillaceae bacterium]
MNDYYVCILASKRNGTFYTGVTNDLKRRVWEHKNQQAGRFTSKYGVAMLVYCERCQNVEAAITREKRLKKWRRVWKLRLIESFNPEWKDLYYE